MAEPQPRKPVSQRRLDANRANARKSTGPRTPHGKRRAARNSVKHGILARDIVLTDTDNPDEDPLEFDALVHLLMNEHCPTRPSENLLVQRIAVCYWRLRRAWRFEARTIGDGRTRPTVGDATADTRHDSNGVGSVLPQADNLSLLLRYEAMIDRELHRCVRQLHALQRRSVRRPPDVRSSLAQLEAFLACPPPRPPTPVPAPIRQPDARTPEEMRKKAAPNKPNPPIARPRESMTSENGLGFVGADSGRSEAVG